MDIFISLYCSHVPKYRNIWCYLFTWAFIIQIINTYITRHRKFIICLMQSNRQKTGKCNESITLLNKITFKKCCLTKHLSGILII